MIKFLVVQYDACYVEEVNTRSMTEDVDWKVWMPVEAASAKSLLTLESALAAVPGRTLGHNPSHGAPVKHSRLIRSGGCVAACSKG
jgi:hypothetical protein